MKNGFYTLPLKANAFISRKGHETCSLKESIAHHIHLINTSYFGECTFDETFGCSIWLIDFDNLKSTTKLKAQIIDSLKESLGRHEKRLTKIKMNVRIKQEEVFGTAGSNRMKKRIDLNIKATVVKTKESFTYVEYFYIGPLSY